METYFVTIIQGGTHERRLVFNVHNDAYLIEEIYDEMAKPHWDQCPFTIKSIHKADRVINLV